jgi:hypothetical protein
MLEGMVGIASTIFWLLEDRSGALGFMSLITAYASVPFTILFFATARPKAEPAHTVKR